MEIIRALSLIAILAFSLTVHPRPSNDYLVFFDDEVVYDSQSVIVEAYSFDEAVARFKKARPEARIFSVAQRSYVKSEWINNR